MSNRFNDIDIANWRTSEVITDSLWSMPFRDNSGKHSGDYHGNFIPQIPRQLLLRYTKKGDTVLDPFVGNGTSVYEAERLSRNIIGIDLRKDLIDKINENVLDNNCFINLYNADSSDVDTRSLIMQTLHKHKKDKLQLAILHPPYHDIIKFSDNPKDLSNAPNLGAFLDGFKRVVINSISCLEPKRYLAVVIGDYYRKGEWVPLGFKCMNVVMETGLKLKSIIVKDIQGNRGKHGLNDIWRYRALSSDYYIFKHEYILIFIKEIYR